MQVVCQGTVAADVRIRVQSFTCLHEIAANYYNRLPPYMQVHQGCSEGAVTRMLVPRIEERPRLCVHVAREHINWISSTI